MTESVAFTVRCFNEAAYVPRVLAMIARQTRAVDEIVYLDHDSTDGTADLVQAHPGARVILWDGGPWSYARHLNLAFQHTRSDLVVSLVGHAVPCDEYCLEKLLEPFADPSIAAVYGGQRPFPGCNLLEVRRIRDTFTELPRVQRDDPFFSISHCAIRRRVWEQVRFDETVPSAEDQVWARAVLRRGFALAYQPEAAVFHSHNAGMRLLLRRAWPEGVGMGRLFPRSVTRLARAFARRWLFGVWRDGHFWRQAGRPWWRFAPLVALEGLEALVYYAGVVRGWRQARGRRR